MGVANGVTGSFIPKARMHRLLYGFVLCVESFGGTDEVAEKQGATTQVLAECRQIEEKDIIFVSFHFCCGITHCVCRKWNW